MSDGRRVNWLLTLPPVIFLALAGAFWFGLTRENPDELPSALAGRQAPALALPPLPGVDTPAPGEVSFDGIRLVNFWASWCGPCRAEHPFLERIAEAGVPIIGINYKDRPANAAAFLEELGNPYAAIGVDEAGRAGIDWGLYGVPETFVIDAEGTVLMRHPGPISPEIFEKRFRPLLAPAES